MKRVLIRRNNLLTFDKSVDGIKAMTDYELVASLFAYFYPQTITSDPAEKK
jgi:hypothetical protein